MEQPVGDPGQRPDADEQEEQGPVVVKHQGRRDEHLADGSIDEAAIHPREVIHKGLNLGAAGLILVHNHPSDIPKPGAADIQVQTGYAHLHQGHAEEGERFFLAALEADPSEYSGYLGLSECYRNLQRPEDQLAMVKQAMELAPDDPDVWNALGVALEGRGKCVEATEAYEHALSLAPLHRKAANNLGFLLEKRMLAGEVDLHNRAMEAWKLRLLICRDEGQSLKKATEHLVKLGVAEDTIRRWLEHDPTPGS